MQAGKIGKLAEQGGHFGITQGVEMVGQLIEAAGGLGFEADGMGEKAADIVHLHLNRI